jgi:hypothetical protein
MLNAEQEYTRTTAKVSFGKHRPQPDGSKARKKMARKRARLPEHGSQMKARKAARTWQPEAFPILAAMSARTRSCSGKLGQVCKDMAAGLSGVDLGTGKLFRGSGIGVGKSTLARKVAVGR